MRIPNHYSMTGGAETTWRGGKVMRYAVKRNFLGMIPSRMETVGRGRLVHRRRIRPMRDGATQARACGRPSGVKPARVNAPDAAGHAAGLYWQRGGAGSGHGAATEAFLNQSGGRATCRTQPDTLPVYTGTMETRAGEGAAAGHRRVMRRTMAGPDPAVLHSKAYAAAPRPPGFPIRPGPRLPTAARPWPYT